MGNLSIGRGRGSRDEVEEVELRREIIRSSVGESKESRKKGNVMGVGHKVGVGKAERVAESLSLNALSKRSGNCSRVVVGRGALNERPSSWAESRCIDLLSLESLWNLYGDVSGFGGSGGFTVDVFQVVVGSK